MTAGWSIERRFDYFRAGPDDSAKERPTSNWISVLVCEEGEGAGRRKTEQRIQELQEFRITEWRANLNFSSCLERRLLDP